MYTLKTIKSSLKQSYDKQNLTLRVISYEIYEIRRFINFIQNDHSCKILYLFYTKLGYVSLYLELNIA